MVVMRTMSEAEARCAREWLLQAGQDRQDRCWYVLQVARHAEVSVDDRLGEAGIERWLPVRKVAKRRRNKRAQPQEVRWLPALPGYVFAKVHDRAKSWAAIVRVDGVTGVLPTVEQPTPVSDHQIDKLKAFIERDPQALDILAGSFSVGQKVRIDDGPFAGHNGVVLEMGDDGRAVIGVTLFGRMVRVSLNVAQISKWD